jgi:hypothetical protein
MLILPEKPKLNPESFRFGQKSIEEHERIKTK